MLEYASRRYDFPTQQAIGAKGEEFLDTAFRNDWKITPVDMKEQRRGIDRHWQHRRYPGITFAVEYKTDVYIDENNDKKDSQRNAFIEIVSNDATETPGWALYSEADYLVYLIWESKRVFVMAMEHIKCMLPIWMMQGRSIGKSPNPGYDTHGILVPLSMLKSTALWDTNKAQQELALKWYQR